jgi:hypothetical protein
MISSYMNMYATNDDLIVEGDMLPEDLLISNKAAHFLTLDKVITQHCMSDLIVQEEDSKK